MKRVLLLFVITITIGTSLLHGQLREGFYVKVGMNQAFPKWDNYELVMQEYCELRPWLVYKPEFGRKFFGLNLGYGVSGKFFYAEMIYMSNRNLMKFEGTDSLGTTHSGTYTLIQRNLTLCGGVHILSTDYVRIGLTAGVGANPLVFRQIGRDLKQKLFVYMFMPLLAMRYSPNSIEEKFYLGATFSANIQIGGRWGLVAEPFYVLPFWKTDATGLRDALNPNTPSAYTKEQFKQSLNHWGIRFSFFIGAK